MFKKISKVFFAFILALPLVAFNPTLPSSEALAKEKKSSEHLWEYKRKHGGVYPISKDVEMGTYYMNQQVQEFKNNNIGVDLPKDAALRSRLQTIMNRLARVSDQPSLPYEIHVINKDDIANAYCLPGGKMAVFTGLFNSKTGMVNINSNDEIAAVIGHEMAHATMRHTARKMGTMQGIGIASAVIGTVIGVKSRLASDIFSSVTYLGVNLYIPSYSRKFETEADRVGLYYMAKAGYNPQAAVNVWKKASVKRGQKADKTAFFDSHPASGVRAKTLEKWLPDAELVKSGKAK